MFDDYDEEEYPEEEYPEEDDREESFSMEFGNCYFPDKCCMPGPHYPFECFTAEMAEEERKYNEMIEREEKYPILRPIRRVTDWIRRIPSLLFTLPKNTADDDDFPF